MVYIISGSRKRILAENGLKLFPDKLKLTKRRQMNLKLKSKICKMDLIYQLKLNVTNVVS